MTTIALKPFNGGLFAAVSMFAMPWQAAVIIVGLIAGSGALAAHGWIIFANVIGVAGGLLLFYNMYRRAFGIRGKHAARFLRLDATTIELVNGENTRIATATALAPIWYEYNAPNKVSSGPYRIPGVRITWSDGTRADVCSYITIQFDKKKLFWAVSLELSEQSSAPVAAWEHAREMTTRPDFIAAAPEFLQLAPHAH